MHLRLTYNLQKSFRVLAPALLLLLSAPNMADNSSIAKTQEDLKALAASIKALQEELKSAHAAKSQLQQTLQASEKKIGQLTKKVQATQEALDREKKQLSQLQAHQTELEHQRKQQQQQISHIIRQMYTLGQQSRIRLLLNQEDPHQLSRLLHYHSDIVRAHQRKIDTYLTTIRQLDSTKSTIIASTSQLEKTQSKLAKRQNQLRSSQAKRRQVLTKINQKLQKKGQALSQLTLDRQRLQDFIDEATEALANIALPSSGKPFSTAKGKLPFPTAGKLIHQYGSPQFNGKLKRNGVFIRNHAGADVVSVYHGRVIFSDYLRGHGLLLIIDHGDGYMSLYGHNQTLLKETGDWVNRGEVIATVGNSGGQQQTGLHFEIRYQGQPQNPQQWLRS